MKESADKFSEYIAKCFSNRLKELGMSRYRFEKKNLDIVNHNTFDRIMKGKGGVTSNTLAAYCDRLGLEIIIRPKKDKDNENNS